RAVRRVAGLATFDLDRGVLEGERPGLVAVALQTGVLAARPRTQLFGLEAAVLVVAIAAFDGAFGNLVVEGARERGLLILVALVTAFGLLVAQQEFRPFGRV